ncbi:Retrovirus-related Pol polyprotein from transposon 17.6 [Vitis vinifera]|uniref:Retrovirus-related Pol polyprotein from transposon 17.6 n=1 Tax=Vitis vinifera TaxID=29760 RepID=A0A438G2L2_VITVI|nr:Retrovirus-related Pol polyprotein from transposon 17.6 [Vitis vinifera]
MYMEALVNGKATKALVDTGATHNFVSEDEARRLELQASKEGGWLKAVNSAAKPSHGVARGNGLPTEGQGRATTFPTPMAILEEEKPCMVPTVTEEKDDGSGEPMPKEIEGVLDEFKDVMPPELPKRLPPRREEDHKIELEPGAKPPAMGPYRMAPPELEELRRQLKELLDAGFIQPSKAPYGAPVTVKNKYPIPLIADLFDQLGRARYFTKLDLSDAFRTHQCPSNVLHPHEQDLPPILDKFVVVYLDDIVIYSNTLKEHVEHLRKVFKILRQNELYVKKEKCSFAKEEVSFLGHRIRDGKLMMDDSKVKPSKNGIHQPRAAPLTDLLKKNKAWEWDERCQQAFEDLKKAVTEEPVLALPDHTKVFEVHTDASDFAIGGVLMQERHPIAFESRKLNDRRGVTRCRKEMTAIVTACALEAHYLRVSLHSEDRQCATSYFQTEEASPKQARWQDFLAEFDYTLEYKPGSANHVADALSAKPS